MALSDKTIKYTPDRTLNLGLGDSAISGTHSGDLTVLGTVKDSSNNYGYGILSTGTFNDEHSYYAERQGNYKFVGTQDECNEALKNLELKSTFAYQNFVITLSVRDGSNTVIESSTITVEFVPEQNQYFDTGTMTATAGTLDVTFTRATPATLNTITVTHQKNSADIEDKIQCRIYNLYHPNDPKYSSTTTYFYDETEYGLIATNLQVAGFKPVYRVAVADLALVDPSTNSAVNFSTADIFPHTADRGEFNHPKWLSTTYRIPLDYTCGEDGMISSATPVSEEYCGSTLSMVTRSPSGAYNTEYPVRPNDYNTSVNNISTFTDTYTKDGTTLLKLTGQLTYAWEFTGTASEVTDALNLITFFSSTGQTQFFEYKFFNGKDTVII